MTLATSLVFLTALAPAAGESRARPSLNAEGDPAAGHVTLSWDIEGATAGARFELQEALEPSFEEPKTLYLGPQHSSVYSGLPNGARFYRVRHRPDEGGAWGPWSHTERFVIEHHALSLALLLAGLGAVVFAATLVFLLTGTRMVARG